MASLGLKRRLYALEGAGCRILSLGFAFSSTKTRRKMRQLPPMKRSTALLVTAIYG